MAKTMTPADIPADPRYPMSDHIIRCHDGKCPERHECRRWMERDTGYRHVHVQSLFPCDLPLNKRCPHRIAKNIEDGG